ncbi:hypothetical protein M153_3720006401 [Pseudoloma neurophilia]|uniref:Uncharacterized protein n=1 Tax=Pseudoloma neurophilia TaxID=146866 RepID=A0A0R0LXW6_9MICR|nr:hypothetical protein M153_3720006401 [Pseudoloma neurophilia]
MAMFIVFNFLFFLKYFVNQALCRTDVNPTQPGRLKRFGSAVKSNAQRNLGKAKENMTQAGKEASEFMKKSKESTKQGFKNFGKNLKKFGHDVKEGAKKGIDKIERGIEEKLNDQNKNEPKE